MQIGMHKNSKHLYFNPYYKNSKHLYFNPYYKNSKHLYFNPYYKNSKHLFMLHLQEVYRGLQTSCTVVHLPPTVSTLPTMCSEIKAEKLQHLMTDIVGNEMMVFQASFVHIVQAKLGQANAGDNKAKLMTKLAPEWVRSCDPVIRSPARYRWTTAPADRYCWLHALIVMVMWVTSCTVCLSAIVQNCLI